MNSISRHLSHEAHVKGMYFIAAVSAMALLNIVKNKRGESLMQLCLSSISASILLAISSLNDKKASFNDRVHVFFSNNDKKSVVTLYESQIHKIHITSGVESADSEGHSMVAVLDKVVIGQGGKCRAERKINIQGYVHAWEKTGDKLGEPQVTLIISCKDRKRQLETCFSQLKNKKSLTLVVKTKKYVERAHIQDEDSNVFIEKAAALLIDKRSILVKLLELYTRESSEDNMQKAIYLAGRFIHFVPKTILEKLKKRVKKLEGYASETTSIKMLMNVLNPLYMVLGNTISNKQLLSLKSDILALLKERACRYENLYEALSQDAYSGLISPGIEEIAACYSTKANKPTNSLLRRYISEDKTLAAKMKTIHGFIDACKKHSNTKLESIILDAKLLQHFSDDDAKYAYESLTSCLKDYKVGEAFSISDAIEGARQKVASKYSEAFVGDIVGIAEKTTVNVEKMSVKMEKVRDPEELMSCFSIHAEGLRALKHGVNR
ncbi:hypothetical protein ANPL_02845 [Anaplasma platys]|uniref:Uncharacterized protein n=1 Tax=Anaplasma platys TaxID=949 RepID=A0A858PYJ1_9RICK|nr:hypothetical protein [Anaplasma platys]QJC27630.1 hypothetical protein ANPL_02845 [Anaplasma platys]